MALDDPISRRAAPGAAETPPGSQRARPSTGRSGGDTRAALLNGPILPALVRLALPTMSVLVAQTAVNVAEAYYVGLLGTDALAGAALVFPLFMLMTMMSNGGIGSGVSSAVARAVGAGRTADADAVAFHAIVLAVIAGSLFTLATLLLGPALYHALGGRAGALEAAVRYSNYLFAGAIAVWIVNLQAAALRGAGNVRVPALVTLIGALVMIPASPILIFGLGPMPALGIAGAGIAFGLYYCGAMLVLVRYMASGRSSLHVRVAPLQLRLFADILKVGLPTAFNAVMVNLTVILVTALAARFGTSELAAYGIASRLDYIMIPLLFGLCTATLTMVGINVGAGQGARARRIAVTSALTGAALVGVIGAVVALHPPLWLALFSHDADVLREGATYLRIVAPAYAALGFGFVLAFAGQGAGHVLWPFLASILRVLIAAGGGAVAVVWLGGGMASLAAMITLSLVAYALLCSRVLSGRIWTSTSG
ncbi:MATE family efflux transporter [Bradyrhizobium oligotrophicum]|uniref:MATE family efflux transporter n=1 Tax=Bradyrhizobium oligotrophicum TaxID=44255 RepID=UPI003EBDD529